MYRLTADKNHEFYTCYYIGIIIIYSLFNSLLLLLVKHFTKT